MLSRRRIWIRASAFAAAVVMLDGRMSPLTRAYTVAVALALVFGDSRINRSSKCFVVLFGRPGIGATGWLVLTKGSAPTPARPGRWSRPRQDAGKWFGARSGSW